MEEISDITVIRSRIYDVRGVKVMLDYDLARLYKVETRVLKQAVRRNADRFPDDFMFRLSKEEANNLIAKRVSQNVIPENYNTGGSDIFAFTEHGVLALAYVLRSSVAIQMGHAVVRAFVAMRESINSMLDANHTMEAIRKELSDQRQYIEEILRDMNDNNEDVQAQIDAISCTLAELQSQVAPMQGGRVIVEGFNRKRK